MVVSTGRGGDRKQEAQVSVLSQRLRTLSPDRGARPQLLLCPAFLLLQVEFLRVGSEVRKHLGCGMKTRKCFSIHCFIRSHFSGDESPSTWLPAPPATRLENGGWAGRSQEAQVEGREKEGRQTPSFLLSPPRLCLGRAPLPRSPVSAILRPSLPAHSKPRDAGT